MRAYEALNDVGTMGPGLLEFDPGPVEIWYSRQPGLPQKTTLHDLPQTHRLLGSINGMDLDRSLYATSDEELDRIFAIMQGEVWSPNGEARNLIRSRSLHHTSMSVGDVVRIVRGDDPETAVADAWMCDWNGWTKLEAR